DKMQLTRLPWIIDFLSRSDYDVVCLQEVLDPTATDMLATALRQAFPHIVLPPRDPARLLSSGVFFAARVPIEQVDFTCYPDCSGVDCLASKGITIIRGKKNGIDFLAAGTHLQAGSQQIRDRQYVAMAETLDRHRENGVPLFVLGDFNTGADDPPFENMVRLLRAHPVPVDDPKPYSVDAENSWKGPGQNPRLIDHILLDPAGTGTTITRETIQRARREHEGKTIDLADHYGVVAEVNLSSTPAR
ncbi:MAG TPA: endonuclease/exonuclease/phosphatase family protein, partial [Candidatus Hydrogenedentes bacterium]|nr:endonuclease/exonuclease/phosphatase family protein [Candidatus Hydrogenedentota bacterium]